MRLTTTAIQTQFPDTTEITKRQVRHTSPFFLGFSLSDSTQNEFLSLLLHVVDRVPCPEGEESLQQSLRATTILQDGKAVNSEARELWLETEGLFAVKFVIGNQNE